MLRLLDRKHVPAVPKSYRFGPSSIPWLPRETFEAFYNKIFRFAKANGHDVPTEADVEEAICVQIPKAWCTNLPKNSRTHVVPPRPERTRGGCKSCGRR